MSRLKKMHLAVGTHLLKEFGLDGLKVVDDNFPERYICHCGEVENKAKCSHCGNENFRQVSRPWSTRYTNNFIVAQTNEVCTAENVSIIPANTACIKSLELEMDSTSNTFSFSETYVKVVEVLEKDIQYSVPNALRDMNYREFLISHPSLFAGHEKIFDLALKVEDAIYDPKGSNSLYSENEKTMTSFTEAYRFANKMNNNLFLSLETMAKFKTFFHAKSSAIMQISTNIFDVDTLLKELKLPICFKDYYELDGHVGYGNLGSLTESNVIVEMQNALNYSLMHQQLNHEEILNVFRAVAEMSPEEQSEFLDFYIKNVTFLKTAVVARYKQVRDSLRNLPVKTKVDVKTAAFVETTEYMKKRGINETRVEAFFNIFDKDPLVALDFLAERKKLSDEEKAIADSFI